MHTGHISVRFSEVIVTVCYTKGIRGGTQYSRGAAFGGMSINTRKNNIQLGLIHHTTSIHSSNEINPLDLGAWGIVSQYVYA